MKKIKLTSEHIKSVAVLLESGLSTLDVFMYIRDSFFAKQKELFEPLLRSISSGDDFVSLFSHTTLNDNQVYIQLITSSQANGAIPDGLRDICTDMEIKVEQKRTFIQLLIYPLIVSIVLGLIIFAILIYVVPQLKPIILAGDTGGESIPQITYWLIDLSSVLVQYTLEVAAVIIGIFITVFFLFAHPKAQKYTYALCLKVPIISQITKQYIWSQTARLIFYYTKSGVSISSAYSSILTLTYLPHRYKKLFINLVDDIGKGGVLSDILSGYRDVPTLWTLYARMGETKVGYSAAFSSITQVHERDMLRRIAYIQKLIEPVLMICIGCIVGVFAYAILLPIYGLVQTLQS